MRTIAEKRPPSPSASSSSSEGRSSHCHSEESTDENNAWHHIIQTTEVVASNDNIRLDCRGSVPQAKRSYQTNITLLHSQVADDTKERNNKGGANSLVAMENVPTEIGTDRKITIDGALKFLLSVDANSLPSDNLRHMIVELQNTSKKLLGGHSVHQNQDDSSSNGPHSLLEDAKINPGESKKRHCQEIRRISDYLGAGLHYHAAAPDGAMLSLESNEKCTKKRIAKASQSIGTFEKMVIRTHWNGHGAVSRSNNVPIHFGTVPEEVIKLCMKLKFELLEKRGGKPTGRAMIYRADEVDPGYFRGHLSEEVSNYLASLEILPAGFKIKDSACQQSIIFFNNKDGSSGCHFDRDSSLLYLVTGHKVVRIAPPMSGSGRPETGNVSELDPFSLDVHDQGGYQWEEVCMVPGSVLFIPQYWLHCVRSVGDPNTLALSFQVELKEKVRQFQPSPTPAGSVSKFQIKMEGVPNVPYLPEFPSSGGLSLSNWMDDDTIDPSDIASNFNDLPYLPPNKSELPLSYPEHLPRKSERQIPKCGICSNSAFVTDWGFAEEAWILYFQGEKQPTYCPKCPTNIPKHLICFRCCPRDGQTIVNPGKVVKYPDFKQRPILTSKEFSKSGNQCFRYYEFATGSATDYAKTVKGHSLYGSAGEDSGNML